ncbi:hypothetical protein INR49_017852 [Caranx melampygus]|nr:hypothetical protein INR49_017852 [Caranx melampygus]
MFTLYHGFYRFYKPSPSLRCCTRSEDTVHSLWIHTVTLTRTSRSDLLSTRDFKEKAQLSFPGTFPVSSTSSSHTLLFLPTPPSPI